MRVFQKESYWTQEQLFFDGDRYFESLGLGIKNATHSIDLETFIFQHDQMGMRMIGLLKDAAARGVKVRVVVDGVGSAMWRYFFGSELKAADIEFKVFHRVPFEFLILFPIHFLRGRKIWERLGHRDHRKLCIVDGKTAWVGSMNITSCHLKEFFGSQSWRDTGVRVVGDPVAIITQAFELIWKRPLIYKEILLHQSSAVRIFNSRHGQKRLYEDFLMHLKKAETKIWITTAYFVPSLPLLTELKDAAERGVDVRLLTTEKTSVFVIRWLRAIYYFSLLRSKVRIFEYKPSVMHAKTVIIDSFALVGSTNINHRSLFHDLEVDIALLNPESNLALNEQFNRDLLQSTEILEINWHQQFMLSFILGRFAKLFENWL